MNDQQSPTQIALKAIRLYAESHPRPSCVTQQQAAEMLGVSHVTISKMIKAGTLKLNAMGKLPTSEIDRALEARAA
jgi:excisionase family DNA binding protein